MQDEDKQKRNKKKIVSYILSFLMFLLLLAASLCLFARTSFMDANYVDKVISNSQYTHQLAAQLQEQMADWGAVSGVSDAAIFSDIVTEERIFQDTQKYFQGAMTGSGTVDTKALEGELYQAIYDYAQKGDTSQVSEKELKSNIEHLVQLCADGYRQSLAVVLIPQIGNVFYKAGRFVDIAFAACLILIAIVIAMLYKINHFFKRTLRYTIYALTSVVVIWWASIIWVQATGIISRIALTSQPLYTLATDFMNTMLKSSCGFAAVGTAILAALFLCYYTLAEAMLKRKLGYSR